ncbi:MAG: hypothetical protein HAW63_02555 [Bdellovibrionaceae bacterium]|nr:hypothetical protein [Pseudobdellovibrionaceae bacterium]
MKLLIALLFVLPLSVQAAHYRGKTKHSKKHRRHHRSHHHSYFKKAKHYLIVGTALDFSKKTVGEEKTTNYAIHLGKGIIFKQKYDLAFLVKYEKDEEKSLGLNIATKYLLHKAYYIKRLAKRSKWLKKQVPYVGMGYDWSKTAGKTVQAVGFSAGNRFPISRNMMMALEYTYSLARESSENTKSKGSRITMNWNYFF